MTASPATQATSVYDLLSRLSATDGFKEMLDEVLSASMTLVGANMGYIALYDPQTQIEASRGLPEEYFKSFLEVAPVPPRELPPGQALATGKRVTVPDVYAVEAMKPYLPIYEIAGFVAMQATPLITRNGQPVGAICTFWRHYETTSEDALDILDLYAGLAADLIERERVKEALRLSEERFRLATQGAKLHPWELNLKTNKGWYQGGEQQSEGAEGLSPLDGILNTVHPWDRRRVRRAFLDAEAATGHFAVEHRGVSHDGLVSWYLASGQVIRDREGIPERIVGVSQDITERKQAQTQLQESEERFRRLYRLTLRISRTEGLQEALDEILDSAIHLLGADMGHIWLSDDITAPASFAASKGVPCEYVDYVRSLPPEVRRGGIAHEALVTRKLVFTEDVLSHPMFRLHADALRGFGIASIVAWPMVGRTERPLGVLTAYFGSRHVPSPEQLRTLELYGRLAVETVEREQQIARQRQTEAALKEALVLRNEFLGLVSHELRTPMTIIRGLASVLERQELEKDDLGAVYGDLRDESERLYWLIENMLRLARVEAGQSPEADDLLLHRTLISIVERLKRTHPALEVHLELPPSETIVSAIETYVEQVLHNLLQNAAKYNKRGASVDISTRVTGETVQIRVADRGIGVKDREAVFQPFQREEGAEKRAGGLGLGLAVCKALVEAQGGRIWVEERAGGGSEFCFTLPRVPSAGPEAND